MTSRGYIGLYTYAAGSRMITFPDLPGFSVSQAQPDYLAPDLCTLQAKSHEAVLVALSAHLADLAAGGRPIPEPTPLQELMKDPANRRSNQLFNPVELTRTPTPRALALRPKKARWRTRRHSGRRLMVRRYKQKIRGKRRRYRALAAWVASFDGYFPAPSRNGYGHKSWYPKLPVYEGLVWGPRADREFQRACMRAMVAVVNTLRQQKLESVQPIRIVALISPDNLFSANIEVLWGDWSFYGFFRRSDWTPIDEPRRSLIREWRLGVTEAEFGFRTSYEWEQGKPPYKGELWVVGDVADLARPNAPRC